MISARATPDIGRVWRGGSALIAGVCIAGSDAWGNFFRYQTGGSAHNRSTYDLWSFGPNGVDDSLNLTTSDDINNWSSGR